MKIGISMSATTSMGDFGLVAQNLKTVIYRSPMRQVLVSNQMRIYSSYKFIALSHNKNLQAQI